MKFIIDVLKGAVMGIANVIPGVSGGTMAVAMGIYDKLITALTHLFKEFKKSVKTVLPIGIGMVIGIVGLSLLIEWMFGVIPIQTNLLFIGLILGGVPIIWGMLKGAKIRPYHILGFVVFFALVVGLSFVQAQTEKQKTESEQTEETDDDTYADIDVELSVMSCLKYLGAGIVAAGTMVIPGVSGSMMMMVMGLYETIISSINNLVKGLLNMNMEVVGNSCCILIPFGIGAVVGIFGIAKIIEILLEKAKIITYWCIMGLIMGSPIAIVVVNMDAFKEINVLSAVTGVVALAVGVVIALFLGKDPEKK